MIFLITIILRITLTTIISTALTAPSLKTRTTPNLTQTRTQEQATPATPTVVTAATVRTPETDSMTITIIRRMEAIKIMIVRISTPIALIPQTRGRNKKAKIK